jgi:hypothetical protein
MIGILRYPGGPLREPSADGLVWLDTRPADQGTNSVGITSAAGLEQGTLVYTGISLRNAWSWPATVEQVRLLDTTEGLELQEARMALPGTTGPVVGVATSKGDNAELRLDADFGPLPADLAGENQPGEGRVWLAMNAPPPGEYSYDAVAVDYRVGPFSFTVTYHQALGLCVVPLPAGSSCSLDTPGD